MISVNTNVGSLIAQRVLRTNQSQLNLSLERLSTGLRINRASDDPAGLIASENLRSEIAGVRTGIENATRAGNVLATAEGGLGEISSLLIQLQSLVGQSASTGGTTPEELAANQLQVDSILNTIDRLSGGTTFGGRPLLNGALAYTASGVNAAQIAGLKVTRVGGTPVGAAGASTAVVVSVVQSARTAGLTYTGGAIGAGGVTLEIGGLAGTQQVSLASGTTLSGVAAAFNSLRSSTGVSAAVVGGNVELRSVAFGSEAFVSVRSVAGAFTGGTGRVTGRDAVVNVNGAAATARGLEVTARTGTVDATFSLAGALNSNGASTSFRITGGGAAFLLGSRVEPGGFSNIGLPSVDTASIGDAAVGSLSSLRSGGANSIASGSLIGAQKILTAAIKDVSTTRGRIGALIKYEVNSTINALGIRLENLSEAESRIRDTDFAEETSRLTRYQILTQAATTVLAQVNQAPSLALTLLNNAFR